MNNKIKSFEEFEQRLKKQTVPELQSNEFLTANIEKQKKGPVFLRASFITAFLTIFVSVSIAAAMNITGWKLFNSEGKQVFEINKFEEDDPHLKYSQLMAKYDGVKEKIKKDIPKGEFKYFLAVEVYEKVGLNALSMILNAEEIESVKQIPTDLRKSLHLNDELPNQLFFQTGLMYYEIPNRELNLAEEMYREAKEKGLEYITKDGKLTTNITDMDLRYEKKSEKIEDSRSVQILIKPYEESSMVIMTEDMNNYTEMTKDGMDFLYNKEFHQIYFVKEDKSGKFLISISTSWWPDKFVESEEIEGLIEIAKTFLN